MHSIAEKMCFGAHHKNLNEDLDPYYQRQKCGPLLYFVARFMRIFAGVPWGGATNDSGVVDTGIFQLFRWLFLQKL